MSSKSALHLLRDKYRNCIFASDAVEWAIQELMDGRDSDTLRRLAAVKRPTDWYEVEPLLRQTYKELEYAWPNEEACYWACAEDTANDIVAGRIPPSEGSVEMYRMCVALEFPKDLLAWEYITTDLHPETMSDLSEATFPEVALNEAKRFLDSR
jgi:hypothetical protein